MWQTSEYLELFPKMHDVKFRKHFGFDPSSFIGLKLRALGGFLHEQRELNQAVTVEHLTSVLYRSESHGKIHILGISKPVLTDL